MTNFIISGENAREESNLAEDDELLHHNQAMDEGNIFLNSLFFVVKIGEIGEIFFL